MSKDKVKVLFVAIGAAFIAALVIALLYYIQPISYTRMQNGKVETFADDKVSGEDNEEKGKDVNSDNLDKVIKDLDKYGLDPDSDFAEYTDTDLSY